MPPHTERTPDRRTDRPEEMGNSLTFFSRKKRPGRKKPSQLFFVYIGTERMHQPSPDRKKRCFRVVSPLRHFLLLSYAPPPVTPTQRRGGNGAGREGKQEWINSDPMPLALLIQVGGEMFLGHFLPFVLDYTLSRHVECSAAESRHKYLQERGRWRWTHTLVHL